MLNEKTSFKKLLQENSYFVLLLIYSLCLLFIFSQSSPFFPTNPWNDANAYYSMGMGLVRGLVPYKDMFDHKGPFLFVIQALGYLISGKSFFGIYILESIGFAICLVFVYKTARLFLDKTTAVLVTILFPMVMLASAFDHGDMCEEFTNPIVFYLIYSICRDTRDKDHFLDINKLQFFFNGMMIGFMFWIKFNLVGIWIGYYLCVLCYTCYQKKWKKLLYSMVFTLLGLVAITLPVILYFVANHALNDLVTVYFGFNLYGYGGTLGYSQRVINALSEGFKMLTGDYVRLITFSAALIALFSNRTEPYVNQRQKTTLFACFFFAMILTFFGNTQRYYAFAILPFTLLGFIVIAKLVVRASEKNAKKPYMVMAIAVAVTLSVCFALNSNYLYGKRYHQRTIYQEQFAQRILASGEPTVFTYKRLDLGVAVNADQPPSVYYFYLPNAKQPYAQAIIEEQDSYIREGKTRFIVTVVGSEANAEKTLGDLIFEHYDVIERFEDSGGQYLLFERKPN